MISCRVAFIIGAIAISMFVSEAKYVSKAKNPIKKVLSQNSIAKSKVHHEKCLKHVSCINNCDNLSSKALSLEKCWKQTEEKLSRVEQQISEISSELNKHNESLCKNVDHIINSKNPSSSEAVVVSHYSEVVNKKYRDVLSKKEKLISLQNKAANYIAEKEQIDSELEKIQKQFSVHEEKKVSSKLVQDCITYIVQETDNVADLVRRLDSEVSAGALKILPKCNSKAPHTYPVEFISVNRSTPTPFDMKYQLINIDVTARSQSLVFAPCNGTVVFCKPLKNLGHTMVIHNSECLVVMCGFEKEYYGIGSVVCKGQVIGVLGKAKPKEKYSSMKYVIRTKLDKKWIENK